jgi:hypothetical protein
MRRKFTGAKFSTEDGNVSVYTGVVEEYSIFAEAYPARECGEYGSKNVGMSNCKAGENPAHLKSKVSWAMVVIPGLVGPNRASERS